MPVVCLWHILSHVNRYENHSLPVITSQKNNGIGCDVEVRGKLGLTDENKWVTILTECYTFDFAFLV